MTTKKLPSRDEIAAMSDRELCDFIVASSRNPPDETREMLDDSRLLNGMVFPGEGHAKWRSVTEKIACEHADLNPHWESPPNYGEWLRQRTARLKAQRHESPVASRKTAPKPIPVVREPLEKVLSGRELMAVFDISDAKVPRFVSDLKARGIIRKKGIRYVFPPGSIGRARRILEADERYGFGNSARSESAKKRHKGEGA